MKTLAELQEIREKMQGQIQIRTDNITQTKVVVSMATCGIARGARPVLTYLSDNILSKNLRHISVTQTGCIGLCEYEPIVEVLEPNKDKVTYIKMTPEKAEKIIQKHLADGQVVTEYTIQSEGRP